MPERAEIEALRSEIEGVLGVSTSHEQAREILDRVRDARGDDEGAQAMKIAGDIARDHARRFPDGEPSCSSCGVRLNQDNAAEDATCCDYCVAKAARSSQGEDHEAGIEAAAEAMMDAGPGLTFGRLARIAVAAYLSRVSPSRDGTVAVEALVRLAELCVDDRQKVRDGFVHYASEFEGIVEDRGNVAERALAEFGSARAGENNER